MALDKASMIVPSCLIKDCLAILKRTAKVIKKFIPEKKSENKNLVICEGYLKQKTDIIYEKIIMSVLFVLWENILI
jgi:hypothetical protein